MNLADSAPLGRLRAASSHGRLLLVASWLLALVLVALQVEPLAVAALRDGALFDNDDAMRLVQLREWMQGQAWTDLTQRRLNPPDSPVAHWSRLVELPLAGMILLFSLVADPLAAERIGVALWPMLLLAAFAAAMLAVARRLVRPPTLLVGAVVLALNPVLLFQFLPGRIDHHGAQMALMVALAALAGRALFDGSRRAAAAAGIVCALTLAIGLETALLVGVVAAAFALAWIAAGASARAPVAAFGASLAVAAPAAFLLTVAPQRWSQPTVDSLSLPWLWLAVGGGALLFALARFLSPQSRRRRAVAAVSGGTALLAIFAAAWPAALAGPYADVDPIIRDLWLSGVGEARPLPLLVLDNPRQFLFFLAFPLIGWLGLALAALREGRRRPQLLLLLGLATAALAVALDQMRGAPFASLFGYFGWLYLIDRAAAGGRPDAARAAMAPVAAATLAFAAALPFAWDALAATIAPPRPEARAACGDAADMAALGAQPPGLVLAPLRLGPRILVATRHDVLGAPYHRNNDGNRIALAALSGDAAAARRIVAERGIDYVALCLGDPDLERLGARRPGALVERLVAERPPQWLLPLPEIGPIRAWRVAAEPPAR